MSIGIQEIIVIAVVCFCMFYAVRRLFIFFKGSANGKNPCENCPSGCELQKMLEEKKQECTKNKKYHKKNCCG